MSGQQPGEPPCRRRLAFQDPPSRGSGSCSPSAFCLCEGPCTALVLVPFAEPLAPSAHVLFLLLVHDPHPHPHLHVVAPSPQVVRTALVDAASVSSLITTSECVVVEAPEDKKPAAGYPPAPDMY